MNELKILFIKIFSSGVATGCLLTLFIGIFETKSFLIF